MYKIITTLILCGLSSIIISCNTMEGMGKDIKTGGKKLEKTAKENK